MFAFFGLGAQEVLLLALLGLGVAGVVGVFLFLNRSSSTTSSRLSALEEENRRRRGEEFDVERDRPRGMPPS
jgi:hypothetical protein